MPGFPGRPASTTSGTRLCRNYAFRPEEFFIADHNMLYLAYALTERDREVLAEVVRAAKAASDSLDEDDFETPVGFRIFVGHLHGYYAAIASMVEMALKPTDRYEIWAEQFELWREFAEWYAKECAGLKAEAPPARRRFDEVPDDLPF